MEARRTQCPSRVSGMRRDASDAGESPWRQLRERAEKIPGDKKHDPGLRRFSHRVVVLRSSIQHSNALARIALRIHGRLRHSNELLGFVLHGKRGGILK